MVVTSSTSVNNFNSGTQDVHRESLKLPLEILTKIYTFSDVETKRKLLVTNRTINHELRNESYRDLCIYCSRLEQYLCDLSVITKSPLELNKLKRTLPIELKTILEQNHESIFPDWFKALPETEKNEYLDEIASIRGAFESASTSIFMESIGAIKRGYDVSEKLVRQFVFFSDQLDQLSEDSVKLVREITDKVQDITRGTYVPSFKDSPIFDDLLTVSEYRAKISEDNGENLDELASEMANRVSLPTIELVAFEIYDPEIAGDDDEEMENFAVFNALTTFLFTAYLKKNDGNKCIEFLKNIENDQSRDIACIDLFNKANLDNNLRIMKKVMKVVSNISDIHEALSRHIQSKLQKDNPNEALGRINLLEKGSVKDTLCKSLLDYFALKGDLRRLRRIKALTSPQFDQSEFLLREAMAYGTLRDIDKAFEILRNISSNQFSILIKKSQIMTNLIVKYHSINLDDLSQEKLDSYKAQLGDVALEAVNALLQSN